MLTLDTSTVIILLIVHFIGLSFAVKAMLSSRTPQGAVAWILALVLLPYVSIPLYLVLGGRRFYGYTDERKAYANHQPELVELTNRVCLALKPYHVKASTVDPAIFEMLEQQGAMPLCSSNRTSLLLDGEDTFDEIQTALQNAQEYILLEFYIIKNDPVGERLKNVLIDRARAGVRVAVLYDEIGSHKLPLGFITELRMAGVQIESFNGKRFFLTNIFRINFRNHRKLVIVDGEIAFVGGLNIGMEYLGFGSLGYWRDTFVKLEGPTVLASQLSFVEDWHWSTHGQILPLQWEPKPWKSEDAIPVLMIPSGPVDALNLWRMTLLSLIHMAKKRLWVTTPYFVPDETVLTALQMAALRGVDVRILQPEKCDHRLVKLSSLTYLAETQPYGISIYKYTKGFIHEKVVLCDDELCTVGTGNVDNRSLNLNFELAALMYSKEFNQQVYEMMVKDFSHAELMTEDDFNQHYLSFRIICHFARLMAPVQ